MWADHERNPAAGSRALQRQSLVSLAVGVLALAVVTLLVVVPLLYVWVEALAKGVRAYAAALFADPDTRAAAWLTVRVAFFAVLVNTMVGLVAAWLLARFRFRGRNLLAAVIDLPLSVSPVVAGLSLVLVFGARGLLHPWLEAAGIQIVFAEPGLVLATVLVTFPIVSRQLVPLLQAVGAEEEMAARCLGASAWQMWSNITLRNIRWGLLYAVLLCNARAMGEFGAVYVVSGRIAGLTDTLPLRVEKLFQEYNMPAAFTVASLLALLGVLTLVAKTLLERKTRAELRPLGGRADEGVLEALGPPAARFSEGVLRPVQALSRRALADAPGQHSETPPAIEVDGVTKRFGNFVALEDVSFSVPEGSLLALLGPSGSGKTTLLRVLAGLERPDRGCVRYRGNDVTLQPPHERNVGFVFQHYALFRHMSVYDNVAFGLRVRRWPRREIDRRVRELLHLVRLEGLEGKRPAELSGGQRQRVALARALAPEPEVLLLDEPFGALDAKVRRELRDWLRRLHDEIGVTSVFVTHDQEEAFEVADRVVLLHRGRIEQSGTPVEVFEHPANAFVTEFLGYVNKFPGTLHEGRSFVGLSPSTEAPGRQDSQQQVTAYVRPHELEVDRIPRGVYSVEARVLRVNPLGGTVKLELVATHFGMPLRVELPWERYAELRPQPQETLFVFPKKMRIFAGDYRI